MWDKDLQIKPAGESYRDLIFKQFWTNESNTTDANGTVFIRGFSGDNQVAVTHRGQTIETDATLSNAGTVLEVQLPGFGSTPHRVDTPPEKM